jgi:hypothetical protein
LIEAIAEQAKGLDWAKPSRYRLSGVDEVLDLHAYRQLNQLAM